HGLGPAHAVKYDALRGGRTMHAVMVLLVTLSAEPTAAEQDDRLFDSALACYAEGIESEARVAIQAEEASARRTGLFDFTTMKEQEMKAKRANNVKRSALAELGKKSLAPMSCSQPEVLHLVVCLRGMRSVTSTDWCQDPAWREFSEKSEPIAQAVLE
ncbi:MAG TPA: hypothetical protein VMK12_07090, partial [Anaeromyxobacteraceae bacterium]|nr:hypothetical protein [Anaeromyxobacteraceae bacterium]